MTTDLVDLILYSCQKAKIRYHDSVMDVSITSCHRLFGRTKRRVTIDKWRRFVVSGQKNLDQNKRQCFVTLKMELGRLGSNRRLRHINWIFQSVTPCLQLRYSTRSESYVLDRTGQSRAGENRAIHYLCITPNEKMGWP